MKSQYGWNKGLDNQSNEEAQYGWNRYSGNYSFEEPETDSTNFTLLVGKATKLSIPNIANLPNWKDHTTNTTYKLALQALTIAESLGLIVPYEAREKSNLIRSRRLRFSGPKGKCSVSGLNPVRELKNPFYQVGSYFIKHPEHPIREKEWVMSEVWGTNYARWFHFPTPDFTWVSPISDFLGCEPQK